MRLFLEEGIVVRINKAEYVRDFFRYFPYVTYVSKCVSTWYYLYKVTDRQEAVDLTKKCPVLADMDLGLLQNDSPRLSKRTRTSPFWHQRKNARRSSENGWNNEREEFIWVC